MTQEHDGAGQHQCFCAGSFGVTCCCSSSEGADFFCCSASRMACRKPITASTALPVSLQSLGPIAVAASAVQTASSAMTWGSSQWAQTWTSHHASRYACTASTRASKTVMRPDQSLAMHLLTSTRHMASRQNHDQNLQICSEIVGIMTYL